SSRTSLQLVMILPPVSIRVLECVVPATAALPGGLRRSARQGSMAKNAHETNGMSHRCRNVAMLENDSWW
ncbi:MAG TPA: hypothetical protein VE988_25525, partial [Gemmataceae bacterium]|nr:hypothetical protein [Gemmataceae bacterium]